MKSHKSDKLAEVSRPNEETFQIQTWIRALTLALVVSVVLAILFAASYLLNVGQKNIVLESLVNPNTAPAVSLMLLPGIGPVRADAIVEYREQFATGGKAVFEKAVDLEKVRGIGPKTAAKAERWLCFE